MNNKHTIVIAGPVCTQSGYGHHTREIVSNIIEQKDNEWDIKLISMPWGSTPMTYPVSADVANRIVPLPLQSQPDVWIQVSVPNELQPVGKYNIGVTAGTEGDICPEDWIDKLNSMQLIIVPSQFTKTVFMNTAAKLNKPLTTTIQVVPEYFDETVYGNKLSSATEASHILPHINDIPESFAFLSVGHWLQGTLGEDRKNVSGLLYCFFDTFKNKSNAPALILKTSGATYSILDQLDINRKINEIRDMFKLHKLPNVYVLHGDLSDIEMNALYNHSKIKAMVSFTKSEGFGRPLLEFSTTGKPIIAPHYSGQADFLKQDFICALPGQLTEIHPSAQNPFLIAGAKWFTPDYKYAGTMLLDVKKNYKTWIDRAKRQRYFVNSTFNKTAVCAVYEQVLNDITDAIAKIPKPVELKLPQLKRVELPKLQKVGE
jgi:glycosyltransferase involved in cell wall biosynthesis